MAVAPTWGSKPALRAWREHFVARLETGNGTPTDETAYSTSSANPNRGLTSVTRTSTVVPASAPDTKSV